ncbi:MAG: multidrug DMT transporter permease [Fibrobacteria bacterium]|nr:multidrug DMT transporter permease [Fibrobacteria bacterium]
MVIIQSTGLAILLCVITMLCWGSWANTQKLASREWKFQLFYWDYSIGVLLLSLIFAFTLGSMGTAGRSFLADLGQAEGASIILPILGGVVFNLSNILLVAAIDIAGMAVAFPIGVGIALVEGVILTYILKPAGNPYLLFLGVGFVVLAIIVDAIAYKRIGSGEKVPTKGIVISIAAGVLMGSFFYLVAAGMSQNPDPAVLDAGKVGNYSAVFLAMVGLFLSSFLWNTIVMKKPFTGDPVPMSDYFKGDLKLHSIGILGGIIWCIGFSLNLIAAGKAGYAISYGLGQGATLIGAIWGVFIWKEFKGAKPGTNSLLALMFVLYLVGLGTIIVASN